MIRPFLRLAAPCLAAILSLAPAAMAQDRQALGWGRLLTNDFLGDGQDRWRTSSYAVSHLRGPEWTGQRPDSFGSLIEYRIRGEIIAPATLNGPGSDDRAYVGALSLGVHSHWQASGWDISAGIDLVALGPQTGLDHAQDWFHNLIDQPRLGANVIANQVANAVHPTAFVELAYPLALSDAVELRPFAEVQYGVEDLARVGVDLRIGHLGAAALDIRDVVTGQRYRGLADAAHGWEFTAGADIAAVGDSAYFPAAFGTMAEETRWRARLGAHWQADDRVTFFYGLTYLSPEYVGQTEGQMLGSIKLNFAF